MTIKNLSKRSLAIYLGIGLVLVAFVVVALLYKSRGRKHVHSSFDIQPYISAYTSGMISKKGTIQVVFTKDLAPEGKIGQAADSDLLTLSPSVKGELLWSNARTLEFVPRDGFESDQIYEVCIDLEELFENVPKEAREFIYTVQTIQQQAGFAASYIHLEAHGSNVEATLKGEISFADVVAMDDVAASLTLKQGDKAVEINLETGLTDRDFRFRSEPLANNQDCELTLKGKKLDMKDDLSLTVSYPSASPFSTYKHEVLEDETQTVQLYFSQPLDPQQDFRGLVYGEGLQGIRVKVDGNLMNIYFGTRLEGDYKLQLASGIRSYNGERLNAEQNINISFTGNKPSIQFLQAGTILPATGKIQIPFRAVSLKGVDVEVFQIFESNMGQYFQTNSLSGSYIDGLRRVGRRIFRKTIMLDGLATLRSDNVYALDLSQIVQLEPGAMYRVSLNMRRCLSTYTCDETPELIPIENIPTNDGEGYNDYDEYYYDIDYNWNERNNPCADYYYVYLGKKWTNVLVSNIGLLAKRNGNASLRVFATSITEGKPLSGVELQLLDYQLQSMGTATSDGDGMATFEAIEGRDPFLIIAQQGAQRSYLPVQQINALSYSTFDVGGNQLKRGIQGYIYGERDVWRPGDTLHLSLIVEDKQHLLPENHPVEFTLHNSRGQLVERKVVPGNPYNLYSFMPATATDAPTGNYSLTATIGRMRFTKSLRIETVKPNRLKVNLSFSDDILHVNQNSSAHIESHWLHGAPARNLETDVTVRITAMPTTFPNYEKFHFTDDTKQFFSFEYSALSAHLNADGELRTAIPIRNVSEASGMLNATFRTRVHEDGGGFSMNVTSKKLSPFDSYVGLLTPASKSYYIETDQDQIFKVVALTAEGAPVSNQHLKYAVYKLEWGWWWEHANNDLASYENSRSAKLITDGDLYSDRNGEASFPVRIDYPQWGRYLVRVQNTTSGHVATHVVYWDWPASRERTADRMSADSKVLAITADKDKYSADETAEISIPTPLGGTLLVSVENGAAVLKNEWVEAQAGETKVKIPITEDMAPNVYANVTLLQPYGQTANDLPLRMYGAIPLMVENPKSHLEPVIDLPAEVRPESKVEIAVKEKDGKPMTFTLAVVDEGLLDLTNFQTPDPWKFFYARQALGVNTMDLFDDIIGAYAGRIAGVLSVGGEVAYDVMAKSAKKEEDLLSQRFTPIVRYFGPFHIDSKKSQTVSFQMPNYIGSVRVMAVAANNGSYGSAEKTMAVRNALMVQANLPRVLAPEEDIMLPVTVFAMKDNVRSVSLKLETNDLIQNTGNSQETASFSGTGEQIVNFRLRTTSRTGIARVKVVADGNGEKAEYEVFIKVRNPNPEIRRTVVRRVEPGKTLNLSASDFNTDAVSAARIEVSSLPAIGLRDKLAYITDYPHACLEQQTSRAFVQMLYPELAKVTPAEKDTLERQVKAFIARIAQFQLPTGGFTLWPNMSMPQYWATSYVGHFLIEAKQRGYKVSPTILNNWKRFQREEANRWSPKRSWDNSDLTQAYRLYTLALAGAPQMGIMNRLKDIKDLSLAARWRLATAYECAGAKNAATKLIETLDTNVITDDLTPFGSKTRDRAMLLESLTRLQKTEQAVQMLQDLANRLNGDSWLSTQEIGYSMLAIVQFAKEAKIAKDGVKGTLTIQKEATNLESELPSVAQTYQWGVNRSVPDVSFKNTGKGALFVTASMIGVPESSQVPASSNNISCEVSYLTLDGNSFDPSVATQGKEFVARVQVRNLGYVGDLSELALTYAVPSGWELRNTRMEGDSNFSSSHATYQDFRDDRVFTYFDLAAGSTKTFYFVVNASYRGKFQLPPTSCQAMYRSDVSATTAGGEIQVAR